MDDLQRVIVVGGSCAGKTTFAMRLSGKLSAPHIELDALHWGPDWKEYPRDQFRENLEQAVAQPRWVCDGNYTFVREITWSRATTLIWLDYSFPLVFQRALRRTISRVIRRTSLYSGNRETFLRSFFSRDSILLWVIQSHRRRHKEINQLLKQQANTHLCVVVCKKPSVAENILSKIGSDH